MTVLANANLFDPQQTQLRSADIVIEGETVAAILPAGDYQGGGHEVVDASARLVIPGLINAHTHSHAVAMRGLADRWCLEMSLAYAPWVLESQSEELIYWSAYVGAAEMALNGITACLDLVLLAGPLTPEKMSIVAQAYSDAGIRAVLAPMISDRPLYQALEGFLEFLPEDLRQRAEAVRTAPANETLGACASIFAAWDQPRDRVKPGIAPTILNHCSDRFLTACKAMAEDHGLPLHMHVAESELQARNGRRAYGRSLVEQLAEIGYLGEDFTAAHCVWVDDRDLRLLADSGSSIAHVPVSNLRLGAGIAPVRRARDLGVDVALATDGCNSADRLSIFEVMKQATLVSRIGQNHAPDNWLSSADVFDMATRGGAKVIGIDGVTGRVEVGAQADLTLLDLDSFAFTPMNDPLTQMVNAETGAGVSDVLVAGGWIVRDGVVLGGDVAAAKGKLSALVHDCFDTDTPSFETATQLIPKLLEFYDKSPAPRA